jgi:hypothetical protein
MAEGRFSVVNPLLREFNASLFGFLAGREYPIHCERVKNFLAASVVVNSNVGLPTA